MNLWKFYRWLTLTWLNYVFEKKHVDTPWLIVVRCRIARHPNGEMFYNPGRSEPDHHCVDCGEEIG